MSSILSKLINLAGNVTGTLPAVNGGLAIDASAFSGVVKASAGAFSAATIVNADVSSSAAIAGSKLVAAASSVAGAVSATTQTFTGAKTFEDTTDTTSGSTGAIITAGGIGVAKAIFVGTTGTFTSGVKVKNTGSGSDTLSWYQEAVTWTPTLAFSGGNGSGSISVAYSKYSRIGKTVVLDIGVSVTKGSASGNLVFGGDEPASCNDTNYNSSAVIFENATAATWLVRIGTNTTNMSIEKDSSGTAVAVGDLAAVTVIRFTLIYRTA